MIVLRRASFAPQKRQSWLEWSLTMAIFSARNSSMGDLHPKALVGIENIDFMYRGDSGYLNCRQRLELDAWDCQLTRLTSGRRGVGHALGRCTGQSGLQVSTSYGRDFSEARPPLRSVPISSSEGILQTDLGNALRFP
jgi:hypothetical protein